MGQALLGLLIRNTQALRTHAGRSGVFRRIVAGARALAQFLDFVFAFATQTVGDDVHVFVVEAGHEVVPLGDHPSVCAIFFVGFFVPG